MIYGKLILWTSCGWNDANPRLAGQETTSTVLAWTLIYLVHNPGVQKRMQEELDRVIGNDRLITTSDKSRLPFTSSVVLEGLRLANILVINVPHKLLADTWIDGHLVPKGTCILPQMCVHNVQRIGLKQRWCSSFKFLTLNCSKALDIRTSNDEHHRCFPSKIINPSNPVYINRSLWFSSLWGSSLL